MPEGTLIKGTRVYMSATPEPDNLTQAEFEALTWVEICCPQSAPAMSEEAEIVSDFCISGEEISAAGAAAGVETELTVFYQADCVGQDLLRAGFGGLAYPLKKELKDSPNPLTTTNSIYYTRVIITSWGDNDGTVNDLITNTYGMKIAQPPILVKPEPI